MTLSWWERTCIRGIKYSCDSIPRHVAFIMDGNRRFARSHGYETLTGHKYGLDRLLQVLEWCLEIGVEAVSVFAFSIHNFKRPPDEVDSLMNLSRLKFQQFLEHESVIMKLQVKIRIIGNLSLLPEDVRQAAIRLMKGTEKHDKLTLNICVAYSASEEITRTVQNVVTGIRNGEVEHVDPDFLSYCMYTRGDSPDLLIRTSGETRLSDFLVCQLNRAHLCFLKVTWPDLTLWHFAQCLAEFDYYKRHDTTRVRTLMDECANQKQQWFVDKLNRTEYLK